MSIEKFKTVQHGINKGDLVRRKMFPDEIGLFMGLRTFKSAAGCKKDYTCAEVMWFDRNAPNGDRISTIQTNLLEVINESR